MRGERIPQFGPLVFIDALLLENRAKQARLEELMLAQQQVVFAVGHLRQEERAVAAFIDHLLAQRDS